VRGVKSRKDTFGLRSLQPGRQVAETSDIATPLEGCRPLNVLLDDLDRRAGREGVQLRCDD